MERVRRPDFGHLELEVTFDDPKTFTKPFTVRTVKPYVADTEIFEDVCENERDREHLIGGFKIAPEVLAKYAGTYELPEREVVVEISGDKLIVRDNAHPRDQLFVAGSETGFQSSVSEVAIEFVKDAHGAIAQFTRTGDGKDEKALRRSGAAQRQPNASPVAPQELTMGLARQSPFTVCQTSPRQWGHLS